MRNNNLSLLRILCLVLIAAIALSAAGCSGSNTKSAPAAAPSSQAELGSGSKSFTLLTADKEGNEASFLIRTDCETVGAALQALGLIAGDEGPYGLYVKTVNGVTVDYDKDKAYWCFSVDGEMAMSGVDQTEIVPGSVYAFRIEK